MTLLRLAQPAIKYALLTFFLLTNCGGSDDISTTAKEPEIVASSGPKTCINGFAGSFPCNGYDLRSSVSLVDLGFSNSQGSDIWGWTDPITNKEYAIMCTSQGTSFIDLSDPEKPIVIGTLKTAVPSNQIWRDAKVYKDHVFIVSEAPGHGMQVFDLTRLRDANPNQIFEADTTFTGFGNAHNIVINEEMGYAYINGNRANFNGGAYFIDIKDPKNPVAAGGYAESGYSHDAQVITYKGPDTDYTDQEIYVGSNENEVVIVNVTDKTNPVLISTISYSNVGYTHQGWFTEDQRYFILGDELDEKRRGINTRTIIFDFLDLDLPKEHMTYTGPTAAIDHNGYVKGNTFFLANYKAGVRMIDVSNIADKQMNEISFFDTVPNSDSADFEGVWSVYPFFESGNIVISDIQRGLFIIKKSN